MEDGKKIEPKAVVLAAMLEAPSRCSYETLADLVMAAIDTAGLAVVPKEPTREQIVAMTHAEPLTYFPLKLAAEGRRKQYRAAIQALKPVTG